VQTLVDHIFGTDVISKEPSGSLEKKQKQFAGLNPAPSTNFGGVN
jgi:hypothetical protein